MNKITETLHMTIDKLKKIKLNPKEVIRRLVKILFLVLILYLSLTSINKLNNSDIRKIISINLIVFCVIDTLYPAIYLPKK
tara:strand:+ start:181 stop:423 length:243 start_codon:yes stop_codon:yes gene_type:complete